MQSKKVLKIVVPIVMALIVAGIFLFQAFSPDPIAQSEKVPEDFTLSVTAIDLPSLKEHGMPMILDFGADDCVPCKEMAPVLVNLNAEMQGQAIIKFVDVWKNPNGSTGFPVTTIPTQILVNADGTPYTPSEEVSDLIVFQKYAHKETGEHIFTTHQGGLTEEQMRLILADMGVEA